MMTLKILLLASISLILLRFLLLKRWSREQCPRCGHSFLIRIKRNFRGHLLASFLVAPLRRYQCQFYSCKWRGLAHYSQRKNIKKIKARQISNKPQENQSAEVAYATTGDIETNHKNINHSDIKQISHQYSEAGSNSLGPIPQVRTDAKELIYSEAKHPDFWPLQGSPLRPPASQPLVKSPLSFVATEPKEPELFTSEVSLYRRLENNNEFIVKYQPIINIKNNNIIGLEALLHWEHPERGLISPLDFIPLADKNTLILPLGKWVLAQACLQAKSWQNRSTYPLFISVNISSKHFYLPNLVQLLVENLQQNDLSPQSLELDVSLSTLSKDIDLAKKVLTELRAQGIRVCLDNFDAHSLLPKHLGESLFSTVKTHISLIQNLESQSEAYEAMESILSLSLELGFDVVAKGVETREQLGLIRSLGCEIVQGYLFDPPLAPEEATDVLRANWLGRTDQKPPKSSPAQLAST